MNNTCQACEWWQKNPPLLFGDGVIESDFGVCKSNKITYDDSSGATDVMILTDSELSEWPVKTGKDYGCVHWKELLPDKCCLNCKWWIAGAKPHDPDGGECKNSGFIADQNRQAASPLGGSIVICYTQKRFICNHWEAKKIGNDFEWMWLTGGCLGPENSGWCHLPCGEMIKDGKCPKCGRKLEDNN